MKYTANPKLKKFETGLFLLSVLCTIIASFFIPVVITVLVGFIVLFLINHFMNGFIENRIIYYAINFISTVVILYTYSIFGFLIGLAIDIVGTNLYTKHLEKSGN